MGTERLNRAAEAAGYALAGYDDADEGPGRETRRSLMPESQQPKLQPLKPPQTMLAWLAGFIFPQAGATS